MELRQKAKEHLNHVGRKAVVAGDAARRDQEKREQNDSLLSVGSKVHDFCLGTGVIKKINKKTYTITWNNYGNTYTRDKIFVQPV